MKKIAIAALALAAAGAAMAEVTSQNIVGYQDFTGTGSFNLTAATFLPIGTDGTTMTLGDIVGNDTFVAGTDYVNIYSGGSLLMSVTYSDAADAAEWGIDSGWYTLDDYAGDAENNLNATTLPYGTGIALVRTTSGAGLIYAGEVKAEANMLPATGSFNICGNTTPVDITLAEVTANDSFVAGTDYVNLYSGGSMLMSITYSNPTDAAEWGIDTGWYTLDDYSGDAENNLNSTAIAAGVGFAFVKTTATARLIVASPISE